MSHAARFGARSAARAAAIWLSATSTRARSTARQNGSVIDCASCRAVTVSEVASEALKALRASQSRTSPSSASACASRSALMSDWRANCDLAAVEIELGQVAARR